MTKPKKEIGSKTRKWIYPEANPKYPHICSPDCKRSETEAGCLGCPLA